jgi:hypothetical protein
MSTRRRVRVISEGGRVIGIFAPYPPDALSATPLAELHAGPGQHEHEVDVDWPAERELAAISESLHGQVRKALQLK